MVLHNQLQLLEGAALENVCGDPIKLDGDAAQVRGVFTGVVAGEAATARVLVVWETSPNGRDWLGAARVELLGVGARVAEVSPERLFGFVRARVELRGGATLVSSKVELLSSAKLVKGRQGKAERSADTDSSDGHHE